MSQASERSRGRTIASWVAVVVAAGILAFSGVMKLAMYDAEGGPHVIAEAMGWSRPMFMALGAVELLAAVLLLVPKTSAAGGILAALLMLGALGAHATKLGFGGQTGGMWPLAVVVLLASVAVVVLRADKLGLGRRQGG